MPAPIPELNDAQRKHLRRLGHDRKAIVLIGHAGIGPTVIAELDRALEDHELVKVKARLSDRNARDAALAALASSTSAALVQRIGNVALFYRRHPQKPGILLPD